MARPSVDLAARFYRLPHAIGTTTTAVQSCALTAAAAIVLDAGPATAADWLWWLPAFALVSAILMGPLTALWFSWGLLVTAASLRRAGAAGSTAESPVPPFRRLAEHGKARVRALTAFWRRACGAAAGPLLFLGAASFHPTSFHPTSFHPTSFHPTSSDPTAWPRWREALPFAESLPDSLALPLLGWPLLAAALLLLATVLDRCAGRTRRPLRETFLDRARRHLPLLTAAPPLLFLAAWVVRGSPWADGLVGRAPSLAAGALAAPWIALAALPTLVAALFLGWLPLAAGDALRRSGKDPATRSGHGSPRTPAAPGRPFRALAVPFLEADPNEQSSFTLALSCLFVAFLSGTFDLWPADYAHWFWAVPLAGLLAAGIGFPLTATWWAAGVLLTFVDAARGAAPRPAEGGSPASRLPTATREHFRLLRRASRARFRAVRETSAAVGLVAAGLLVLGGTVSFSIASTRAMRASDPAISGWDSVVLTAILLGVLFLLLVGALVLVATAAELVGRSMPGPAIPGESAAASRRRTDRAASGAGAASRPSGGYGGGGVSAA